MKYLRWTGLVLSLAGVAFVVERLAGYAGDLGAFRPGLLQGLLLSVLAVVYGASNVALALAWRDLLAHCGSTSDMRWAVRVFGVTQLAKYIPGNFFHLAGRQTLGMSDGHAAMPLLKSAVWEFAAIVASGLAFGIWLMPLLVHGVSYGYAAVLFVAAIAVLGVVARRYFSAEVMRAILWYVCFIVISALLFFATLDLLLPQHSLLPALPGICGAYTIAWLAGLVTPGAPAGAGIREVVMFALLQSTVGQSELLLAIVISRAITVAGDVLFYLYALAITARA